MFGAQEFCENDFQHDKILVPSDPPLKQAEEIKVSKKSNKRNDSWAQSPDRHYPWE